MQIDSGKYNFKGAFKIVDRADMDAIKKVDFNDQNIEIKKIKLKMIPTGLNYIFVLAILILLFFSTYKYIRKRR